MLGKAVSWRQWKPDGTTAARTETLRLGAISSDPQPAARQSRTPGGTAQAAGRADRIPAGQQASRLDRIPHRTKSPALDPPVRKSSRIRRIPGSALRFLRPERRLRVSRRGAGPGTRGPGNPLWSASVHATVSVVSWRTRGLAGGVCRGRVSAEERIPPRLEPAPQGFGLLAAPGRKGHRRQAAAEAADFGQRLKTHRRGPGVNLSDRSRELSSQFFQRGQVLSLAGVPQGRAMSSGSTQATPEITPSQMRAGAPRRERRRCRRSAGRAGRDARKGFEQIELSAAVLDAPDSSNRRR